MSTPKPKPVDRPARRRALRAAGATIAGHTLSACGGGSAAEAFAVVPDIPAKPATAPAAEASPPTPTAAVNPQPAVAARDAAPQVLERVVPDRSKVICCSAFYDSNGLYTRAQHLVEWTGAQGSLVLRRKNLLSAASPPPDFTPARSYTVLIDGKPWARADFAAGQTDLTVSFALDGLAEGWHEIDLAGCADGETFINWAAYRYITGTTRAALMPVFQGSHAFSWDLSALPKHRWVWVPSRFTPTPAALTERSYPDISAASPIRATLMAATDMGQDILCPNVNVRGVMSTHGMQAYFWAHVDGEKTPTIPLLDGPRGVSQIGMVLHIECATAAPGGVLRDVVYLLTPWSVVKMTGDGNLRTLAGYVHDGAAGYWKDGSGQKTLKLRGDWSAIPAERRGYRDPWGIAWLQTATDEAAAPIAAEENQKPHLKPPLLLVADSHNNRILAHEFSAVSHSPEPVVTEWLTGLADPWGVATWHDEVLIAERTGHRIIAVNSATKRVTRVVLQRDPKLPGNATMLDWQRAMIHDGSPVELRRAQPCLAPETLRVWGDWLYYSSYASESIKRVHLVNGEVQLVTPVDLDRQSNFVTFDVCQNDAFAPAGTVFYNSWGPSNSALQYGVQPDGKRWTQHAGAAPWNNPQAYAAGVGIGLNGRMYVGGSAMGVTRLAAGPKIDLAKYEAGKAQYLAAGGWIKHGPGGFGYHGFALPWGISAELDYYLQCHDLPQT